MSLANHAKKASEAPVATATAAPAAPAAAAGTVIEGTSHEVLEAHPRADDVAAATDTPAADAVAEPKTTAVAEVRPASMPAPSKQTGGAIANLESEGFEGLKLGFGAFPGIVLPSEGRFKINGQENFIGEAFTGHIHSTKSKWIVKVDTQDKDLEKYVYTYDNPRNPEALTTGGTKVADFIAEQEAKGQKIKIKDYLDVLFEVNDELGNGELNPGDLVLLSIPDTSIKRLSGYLVQLQMRKKNPRDVVTRVSVGAKITTVAKPYYPWSFKEHVAVPA